MSIGTWWARIGDHEFNIYGVNGQLTIVGEARVGPVVGLGTWEEVFGRVSWSLGC